MEGKLARNGAEMILIGLNPVVNIASSIMKVEITKSAQDQHESYWGGVEG